MIPFDPHSALSWMRVGIALVWLVFGLLFKALGMMPRHKRIVARVVGERAAGKVTSLVAAGEIGLALWMFSGRFLPICMGVQTLALASMNTLEIRYAKDLLVSPIGMICANAVLLSAGWYVALAGG